jgi:hypothetical protein
MALTGALTYKGLAIPSAYLRVMTAYHRVVDTPIEAEDGTITWSKTLYADYTARVYHTPDAYVENPDEAIYTISGSFTPSVANAANLNIVKQTYLHLKTLADYDELTDV